MLSVRACGSNQGKAGSEPLRARFAVIRVEMYHRAAPGREYFTMRQGFEHQPTNRPEVDAGNHPAGAAENSRRTVTGKTTAGKTETYMEYHKGMNNCLFLDYCRRRSEISVKGRSDGNPMGRRVVLPSVRIDERRKQPKPFR